MACEAGSVRGMTHTSPRTAHLEQVKRKKKWTTLIIVSSCQFGQNTYNLIIESALPMQERLHLVKEHP
jgi:hypothetical protein